MDIQQLKNEFFRGIHETTFSAIRKQNFSGYDRKAIQTLINGVDYIEDFRKRYESDIIKIAQDIAIRSNEINTSNKISENRETAIGWIFGLLIIYYLWEYISWPPFLGTAIILPIFFGWLLGMLILSILKKVFPKFFERHCLNENERGFVDWDIMRSNEEINSYCRTCKSLIVLQIKELKKKESKEYLKNMNPYEFEKLVATIFDYFEFKTKVTKGSGDKGIDIHLEKNGEKQIVQCKRFKGKIGTPIVRDFIGTMHLSNIHVGYIVTTSEFSYEVVKLLSDKKYDIKLIDLDTLEVLVQIKNDGQSKENFFNILEEGMDYIIEKTDASRFNQKMAQDNYTRNYSYFKKKR